MKTKRKCIGGKRYRNLKELLTEKKSLNKNRYKTKKKNKFKKKNYKSIEIDEKTYKIDENKYEILDEWKGILDKTKYHIRVLKLKNSKRKPIISIFEFPQHDWSVKIKYPFVGLEILPPSKNMFGQSGILKHRLLVRYTMRGSYQDSGVSSYTNNFLLTSKNKSQIDTIKKMLSKYTKNIKHVKKTSF